MTSDPRKSVCFATPSLNHTVAREFFRSSLQTNWALLAAGYAPVNYLDLDGDQFIAKARNKLMNDFLVNHPDCDNLFFIDDDIGWPAEKVIEFLERDEDILVGVYPKKSEIPDWPVVICGDEGQLIERDGLVRCMRGPTGFMRIKRRVIEGLLPHVPRFLDQNLDGEPVETPAWFASGIAPDGWFWTEDYIFCQNASNFGYEIWCDPDIHFTHRGNRVWKGRIADDLPTFRERAKTAHLAKLDAEKQMAEAHGKLVKVGDDDVIDGEVIRRSDAA